MSPFKKKLMKHMVIIGIILVLVGFIKVKGLIAFEKDRETTNNIQILTGQTDIEGEGISITVEDKNPYDVYGIVYDKDLITIVNILQSAGAEVISINDERVLSTNKIKVDKTRIKINKNQKLNKTKIKINDNEYNSPFLIKAIGNSKKLNDILNSEPASAELKEFNYMKKALEIRIEKKDKLIIPRYKGNISFKYAKPIKM
ncbi:DUF881 domain-containing protein [Tepidibacter formicigenes]|jgi:uncharacterized protein YlxW (UPF0749 family)|uniref:Uncharacterized protein n=1 Tax=Tepidibacter formicigenes DSM 15518 TaxID=1123349 RepID=A0A1M6ND15_9FIRM|nr:DUF881 domain-containing protein [Tepidibacter formicigenes]SHJ93648.1 protein of unknown function [Tepidibacter formicigenes DSM 15518]